MVARPHDGVKLVQHVGIRLDENLERRLAAVAKREGRSKSAVARAAIRRYLEEHGLAEEARRQSLAIADDAAERDALGFIASVTDDANDEP